MAGLAIVLALLMPTDAVAQFRTFYDSGGRVLGRSTPAQTARPLTTLRAVALHTARQPAATASRPSMTLAVAMLAASRPSNQVADDSRHTESAADMIDLFRARLRAAKPVPPSYDYFIDSGLLMRIPSIDTVVDDSGEDAEPVEPVKRKRRPTLAGTRQVALPPTLAPRLVHRDAAAAYVAVSPNTFDKMVKDGRMPRPKKLSDKRIAWDVRALDAAVDQLPVETADAPNDESWSDVDAPQASAVR